MSTMYVLAAAILIGVTGPGLTRIVAKRPVETMEA